MRNFAASLIVLALAAPAAAQDQGPSLMERGAQQFFEGLMQEMEPAIDDLSGLAEDFGPALRGFVQEMGPHLRTLMEEVEDWSNYSAPEILPNGDIIIRRKPDHPLQKPETLTEPAPQIEL